MTTGTASTTSTGQLAEIRYQDVRGDMKTGDVLLFAGRSALSSQIIGLTGSEFSHSGVVALWEGRVMVFQSAAHGVELLPASKVVCKYDGKVAWFSLAGGVDEVKLIDESLNLLRLKYSFWGLIRFWWKIKTKRLRNRRDKKGTKAALFCSEFVSRVFREAGLDLVGNRPDDLTSPGDIARSPHLKLRGILHFPDRPDYCSQVLGAGLK